MRMNSAVGAGMAAAFSASSAAVAAATAAPAAMATSLLGIRNRWVCLRVHCGGLEGGTSVESWVYRKRPHTQGTHSPAAAKTVFPCQVVLLLTREEHKAGKGQLLCDTVLVRRR